MTKNEISTAFGIFIKAHMPDEFKSLNSARHSFWDILNPCGNNFVHRFSKNNFDSKVARWWWAGKRPMSEWSVLSSMDTEYVTHGDVNIHACYYECSETRWWGNYYTKSNVVDVMFDLSFKYNIIGIEQRPGYFHVWIKESEDHQSNITGEVIEKIAKCLEF